MTTNIEGIKDCEQIKDEAKCICLGQLEGRQPGDRYSARKIRIYIISLEIVQHIRVAISIQV